jgi:hypothetical protein
MADEKTLLMISASIALLFAFHNDVSKLGFNSLHT